MKSWRTTAASVTGLMALVTTAVHAMLDGDPATNPDWNFVAVAAMPLIGLLFARDDKVTSESAGAK